MKPTSDTVVKPSPPTLERRSFIWKAGAAFSGTLASAAAMATAGTSRRVAGETRSSQEEVQRLSNQLGILQDADAIRKLHHAFGHGLNNRLYEEVVTLFAEDSEVHFNGGIFAGKDHGVRRLYVEQFGRRFTAKKDELVHVFLLEQKQQRDLVEVAPNRQSARARFHCLARVQASVDSDLPLMEMARQQGQGIVERWEGGVFENSYVKVGEDWKIKRLAYRAVEQADPAPGWINAVPSSVGSSLA